MGPLVRQSFIGSDRTYGARRVWHDLLALGHACGLHRIERLMRKQALRARPRRRGLPQDRGQRSVIADNVLNRQFQADAPNQKWVADFTYIWTAEGWLYAAAVLDLYSRRIVGWSMHDSMALATTAVLFDGPFLTRDGIFGTGLATFLAAGFFTRAGTASAGLVRTLVTSFPT